ncbi:MAG TPA: hypothetical protein VFZ65_12980 [Planctomycetota bacterium]|nr:hypothetical protein [Planctomycetota bacterium]
MSRTLLLTATVLTSLLAPGRAQNSGPTMDWPQKTFEDSLARYKECLKRKAFLFHWQAREVLGHLGSPEALPLLADDYHHVKEYAEYVRYTIAEVFGRSFGRQEFVDRLRALRGSHRGPGDVWLWYQTLRTQVDAEGDAEAVQVATTDKSAPLRAAAILALGDSRNGSIKGAIVPNCVEFPRKDSDRMVLLGAMTGALYGNRARVNDDDYRSALTAYIGLLEDPVGLSHTAKVQMARHLQIILKAPGTYMNPEAWLEILSHGEVKTPARQTTTASPRFFGIETDGDRLVYVVDMSDSMLKEIEPSAKPQGPLTGPRQKKKKGALLDESDIPWNLIKTRWDLARENLRISLSRLTPDKEFCVVWFGSEAGTLDACKGMVKASRANTDRVMAELDAVKPRTTPDPQIQNEIMPPEGKLRGDTNLHGGLRLAYALHSRGFASDFAYVDPRALTEGCDTILLLTDGDPSVDDFTLLETNYREGKVIHSFERGEAAPDTPTVRYSGPFVSQGIPECPTLVADVRRMNAFRRVRMHAVGFGEANMKLLRLLADIGQGESFAVGSRKPDAGEGAGDKSGK